MYLSRLLIWIRRTENLFEVLDEILTNTSIWGRAWCSVLSYILGLFSSILLPLPLARAVQSHTTPAGLKSLSRFHKGNRTIWEAIQPERVL